MWPKFCSAQSSRTQPGGLVDSVVRDRVENNLVPAIASSIVEDLEMARALVTGSSSGIGLATSVSLARRGHEVIATMRNLTGATELRKIAETEALPISLAELDVNSDASVDKSISGLLAKHDHIDVLVNNAGIGGGGSIEELPLELFREVMETNYFGALRCIKALIPSMRGRQSGCIVNVTSVAGRIAMAPSAS